MLDFGILMHNRNNDYKLDLLDDHNNMIIKSCSDYDKYKKDELRLFCHFHARYLLPTLELIEFLDPLIKKEDTLEIGAGCGDLGRNLGIRMTDNYCQEIPEVKLIYTLTSQPTIAYAKDVEKIDAIEAIKKYKPKNVIGAWVTQWADCDLSVPKGNGSIYGIKENEILDLVDNYILIGSEKIHGTKKIMTIPHETVNIDFVRSRCDDNK